MSALFSPMKIGNVEIINRFVHSATYECMARENGQVSEELINRYKNLAKGGVGLIIPGYLFVHPQGQAVRCQTGIHNDEMIDGLCKLVEAVHNGGSKIAFQLVHAGRQTTKKRIGRTPMAPSKGSRDNIYMVKPDEMSEAEIKEVVSAFGAAARRTNEAGADAVQIHAAHGYLINQFLSPYFNKRKDSWGGSDENRFRFLKEIVSEVKDNIPGEMPVLVKINTQDYTPKQGITIPLAKKYAGWLAELSVDGIEVSCGTLSFSMFNMVRGEIPTAEIVMNFPLWKRVLGKLMFKNMEGKFDIEEGYNIGAAKQIKPVIKDIPLFLVGGIRRKKHMEEIIENKDADFISMSRPFIREPFILKKFKEGKADSVACVSCNKCFAAVANEMPVRCYNNGFPAKQI